MHMFVDDTDVCMVSIYLSSIYLSIRIRSILRGDMVG